MRCFCCSAATYSRPEVTRIPLNEKFEKWLIIGYRRENDWQSVLLHQIIIYIEQYERYVEPENIVTDKQSGKDLERAGYLGQKKTSKVNCSGLESMEIGFDNTLEEMFGLFFYGKSAGHIL